MSTFYLITIVFVVVAPLIVPVSVSIVHGVRDMAQRIAAARPTFQPAFRPQLAGAAA